MKHRSPARFLAPIALVGFFVALVLVLGSSGLGGSGNGNADETAGSGRTGTTATSERQQQQRARTRTYVVKQGDILEAISEKTGVTVAQLLELNPDLDPQALIPGQRLKLRAS